MTDYVTVRGFVATQPETRVIGSNGVPVASFRMASTSRWYDANTKQWKDLHTSWYSVSCFRQLGTNVGASIKVGHPVIVQGRLKVKSGETESGPRTAVEIEAHAVGIDLGFGTAAFSRAAGRGRPEREGNDPGRSPELGGWNRSEEEFRDAQPEEACHGVDTVRGGDVSVDADGVESAPAAALA